MNLIKTKSFEVAINIKGDMHASKLALLLPGRLDTKDYANFVSHQEYLAGRGYFTVAFDPPGTWESPGGIELFTTTNYIRATNELIEYFGNKSTFLMGHSRGGSVAMFVATSNPKVIGFAAINSGFDAPSGPGKKSIIQGFELSSRDLPPGIKKTKQQRIFKLPISFFEDGSKYEALTELKKYVKPKLFFYAKEDEFMTPKEFLEKYNLVSDPKESHMLNCDHDYRYYPKITEEVNGVVGKFVNKYLK